MKDSHCCLSCSQSISQLQVKPKQETQRHFRVNGLQQLKRNRYASAPSWDSKGNCLPTPAQHNCSPSPKADTCHAHHLTALPAQTPSRWVTYRSAVRKDALSEATSGTSHLSGCLLGEKMYSGRQCQNKAQGIKADPTTTSFQQQICNTGEESCKYP